jgi:hypothetical protein
MIGSGNSSIVTSGSTADLYTVSFTTFFASGLAAANIIQRHIRNAAVFESTVFDKCF